MTFFKEEVLKKAAEQKEVLRDKGDLLQKVVEEAVRKVLADAPSWTERPSPQGPLPEDPAQRGSLSDSAVSVRSFFPQAHRGKGSLPLAAVLKGKMLEGGYKTLLVTSPGNGAGTTTVCLRLAVTLAFLSTAQVLLVDGNLRRPGLHLLLGAGLSPGLADVLSGKKRLQEAVRKSDRINFSLLTAGEFPGESWDGAIWERWPDLISALKSGFDCIVIDAPPLPEDPGAELLLPWADASLLVLRASYTAREEALRAARRLETHKGFLGAVWNG